MKAFRFFIGGGGDGDFSPSLHHCIGREAHAADLLHVTAVFSWPLLNLTAREKTLFG
jgi:hypothetical protein